MIFTKENLCETFLKLRLKHNLTQISIAEGSGVSRQTLSYIETGRIKRPKSETIHKLNAFFKKLEEKTWGELS